MSFNKISILFQSHQNVRNWLTYGWCACCFCSSSTSFPGPFLKMRRREKALAPAGFFCNFIGQLPPIVNLFKTTIRGFRSQPVPGPFPFAAFSKKALGTRLVPRFVGFHAHKFLCQFQSFKFPVWTKSISYWHCFYYTVRLCYYLTIRAAVITPGLAFITTI